MAPQTLGGRVFCIAFCLVGIPLTLSVIADMGELIASLVPTGSKASAMLPRWGQG